MKENKRVIKIDNFLFIVEDNLKSFEIQEALEKVDYDLIKFVDEISKEYFIEQYYPETFISNKCSSKTILLSEDKQIDNISYMVAKNTSNEKIKEIISFTNNLWSSISEMNENELEVVLNKLPVDLTKDNLKIGGQFISDWHSLFTILLKEYEMKYTVTESVLFAH